MTQQFTFYAADSGNETKLADLPPLIETYSLSDGVVRGSLSLPAGGSYSLQVKAEIGDDEGELVSVASQFACAE